MRRSVTESLLLVTMLYFVMPNVGAKGQAQAAHKMRSMRRLGLSSDRRERP